MRRKLLPLLALSLLTTTLASADDHWPSFRGEQARGTADDQDLPLLWDRRTGTNIAWIRDIPGSGHSSPIVANGRVFVVTAITEGDTELVLGDEGGISLANDLSRRFSWQIYCLDAANGDVVWHREAYSGVPRATRHVKSSQANATPATDGRTVTAIFGSQGLVAYDFDGKERWRVDLGVLDPGYFGDASSQWGHASSPVIDEGRVFVQVDRHKNSFVAAYDLATGKNLWRSERNEKPIWATPTIDKTSPRAQLIVLGGDFDRGLDPATGTELWRFPRDLEVKTPTPFVAGDLVILAGGARGKEIHAVSASASGLVQGDQLVWTSEPGGPYTSTPVAYRGRLYFVRDTGIFNVLDLRTGERLHRERIDGTYSASAVASDGKIYLASEDGSVRVFAADPPFRELAVNEMGAPCMATPAIAGHALFLRCGSQLSAISTVPPPPSSH